MNSENKSLVSVIIPVYNCEKYVESAVRSIMNQTYKNLEIIITDDCSTDGTYYILQKLAEEDSRIKLYKNTNNLKIVATLNNMIALVKGKYIARMDSDDISLPNRIEKQVEFLEKHSDYGICGCEAFHISEKGRFIGISFIPNKNRDIQIYSKYENPFYHPTVLIKTELMKDLKYEKKYEDAEDYYLWKQLLLKTKGFNLREKLFYYRIVDTSISRKNKNHQLSVFNELRSNSYLIRDIYKIKFRSFIYIIKDSVKIVYWSIRILDLIHCFIYEKITKR